jgi:hypothetical protein
MALQRQAKGNLPDEFKVLTNASEWIVEDMGTEKT